MPDDASTFDRHDFQPFVCPECNGEHWHCLRCGATALEWATWSRDGIRTAPLSELVTQPCPGPPRHARPPAPDPCPKRRRTD